MTETSAAAAAVVGRIVATESAPATAHLFRFRARRGAPVGIGAIVRVDGEARTVFGVVTDAAAFEETLLPPGPGAALALDDDARPAHERRPVSIYTAAVLRQMPDEPLQPVPLGDVRLASDADVSLALRMDSFTAGERATGIPIGVYAAGGRVSPVCVDADFLLGPEAAHLNITGVSGLATKTSAVEFLLASIFQTFPAHKGSVAALCLNVKGPDLCFLDQAAELGDADRAVYAACGLAAEPFAHVQYFAPCKPDGVNLNTLRTHPDLVGDVQPLVWGLREVVDFADVLMNRDDIDAKADAFLDFLADRVIGKDYEDETLQPSAHRVESFADLEQFFRSVLKAVEGGRGDTWRSHHVATIRKVRNRLGNITTRAKGLVTDDGTGSDLPWGNFADRHVYVVDVAGVDPLAQDLVFARIISKLREHLERRDLGVDHVVVFVDELNKYAPADGPDTYVRTMLLDLAERGRYLGLVLFSAQQFRSQVLRRVVGNAGTAVFGRMDPDELATAGYQTLSPAVKIKLATLGKGELMVRHPHFAQPVFVRFPRPPVLSGREGVERFPPVADLPFAEAVVRQLRRLDATTPSDVWRALIDGRPEDDVRRALSATRRARPDKPLPFFESLLGRRAPAESLNAPRRAVRPVPQFDDPYA